MILILEGENKTGKSTIARYICDHYDFDYIKCSQPKGDPYVEYMEILKKIERSGRNTVLDRFLYGEFVYGPIYRGKSGLSETQKRNIELKALSLNAHVIYCSDDPKNIAKRFKEEKEEFASEKLIKRTLELFSQVISEAIIPVSFHRMKSSDDIIHNEIVFAEGPSVTGAIIPKGELKKKKDKQKTVRLDVLLGQISYFDQFKHFKTAVGDTQNPILVLVGDKRNENIMQKYKKYHQPFDFGVSAEYLFNELVRADIPIGRVMVINSDSKELKDLYQWANIVALGKNASERLNKLGYDYYELTHPSYERRFHGRQHRLAKELGEIVHMDCC